MSNHIANNTDFYSWIKFIHALKRYSFRLLLSKIRFDTYLYTCVDFWLMNLKSLTREKCFKKWLSWSVGFCSFWKDLLEFESLQSKQDSVEVIIKSANGKENHVDIRHKHRRSKCLKSIKLIIINDVNVSLNWLWLFAW